MESSFYVRNTTLNDQVIKKTKMGGQISIFEYSISVIVSPETKEQLECISYSHVFQNKYGSQSAEMVLSNDRKRERGEVGTCHKSCSYQRQPSTSSNLYRQSYCLFCQLLASF